MNAVGENPLPDIIPDEIEMELVGLLDERGGLAAAKKTEAFAHLMLRAVTVSGHVLLCCVIPALG